ncbi:hypothetical protein EO244_05170 [Ancylomarina salipaludis]|uniref:Outer membrane protein assembly factor BamA n=1 Tax=Ancylomarina salipaludis TaxID=2501299 RepID=A0A4Q1JNE6_9BACT|nr:BamA/TamA family outer membrane protein [Ancylomarina salipaludis]RXQ96224.1 hypothetical protein EO244_05170 [Ancylomarina salipaludis]
MIKKFILIISLFLPFSSSAQEEYKLKKVDFKGNNHIKSSELKNVTSLKAKNVFGKLQFWKKSSTYQEELAVKDLDNLHKIYQSQGYIDVKIRDSLVVDEKKMSVRVYFIISENSPTRIKSFAWEIEKSDSFEEKNILKILPKQKLAKTNDIFTDKAIYNLMESAQNSFRNQGYVYAQTKALFKIDTTNKTVDVKIKVSQGDKYVNGKISFEGLKQVSKKLLSKRINLKSGDVFSAEKLNEAQSRAFNMQLFKYITISPEKDSTQPHIIDYKVKLEELNKWDLNLGLGYGTEDRIRAQILLTKRAFLGGIRQLNLGIKTSYFEPINMYLKFRQPNIFADKIDFIWNPYYNKERERSYNVERLGTNFTLEKKLNRKASTFLTYNIESSDVTITLESSDANSEIIEGVRQKSGLIWGYQYRNVDNYFSPTSGWYAQSLTSYNGLGIKTDYPYFKLLLDGRTYQPLWRRWVFASQLRMGYIASTNKTNLTPIEDRFLLGGGNSIRAYQRNSISANTDKSSETIGGNSMLEMSIEARFPIYNALEGVLLGDAGNVWADSGQYRLNDLKYGFGIGLRYNTPIGPLRLDVAAPVWDTFKMQLYITFGHAF